MLKKFVSLLILFTGIVFSKSNAQLACAEFYGAGDVRDEILQELTADENGNVYFGGWFSDSTRIGGQKIIGYPFNWIVAKVDNANNLVWYKIISHASNTFTNDFSCKNGAVYVSGCFTDSLVFDSHVAVTNNLSDIYLAKLDAQTGTCLWLKTAGGSSVDIGYAMTTDDAGNIYQAGTYSSTCTFDTVVFPPEGNRNGFLAKYDPSGNLLWANRITCSFLNVLDISIDYSGNSFLCGYYYDTTDFGNGHILIDNVLGSPFIAKYAPDGTNLWAKKGWSLSNNSYYLSMATDNDDNIYTINRDPLAIVKHDSAGNVGWYVPYTASPPGGNAHHNYLLTINNKLYAAGFFGDKVVFPNDSVISPYPSRAKFFITRIDTGGTVEKLVVFDGDSCTSQNISSMIKNQNNEVYVGGNYGCYGGCTHDSAYNLTCYGLADIFYSKICSTTLSVVDAGSQQTDLITVYPNPFSNTFSITIQLPRANKVTIAVKNILGETVLSKQEFNHNNSYNKTIDAGFLSRGMYLLEVIIDGERTVKKIVKE